jgi:hypothetical protein
MWNRSDVGSAKVDQTSDLSQDEHNQHGSLHNHSTALPKSPGLLICTVNRLKLSRISYPASPHQILSLNPTPVRHNLNPTSPQHRTQHPHELHLRHLHARTDARPHIPGEERPLLLGMSSCFLVGSNQSVGSNSRVSTPQLLGSQSSAVP